MDDEMEAGGGYYKDWDWGYKYTYEVPQTLQARSKVGRRSLVVKTFYACDVEGMSVLRYVMKGGKLHAASPSLGSGLSKNMPHS